MIYKALAEQLFNYGLLLWGGLYKNAIKPLEVVQNSMLRVIYRKPRQFSTKELYSENVCSIRTLYILSVCHFVYKNTDIKKDLVKNCYQTRGQAQGLLNVPFSNRCINPRSINWLAVKLYNPSGDTKI